MAGALNRGRNRGWGRGRWVWLWTFRVKHPGRGSPVVPRLGSPCFGDEFVGGAVASLAADIVDSTRCVRSDVRAGDRRLRGDRGRHRFIELRGRLMTAPETSAVTWGGERLSYTIRPSPRRKKTVAVTVDPGGSVLLAAPVYLPSARLDEIVIRKAPGIVQRAPARREPRAAPRAAGVRQR